MNPANTNETTYKNKYKTLARASGAYGSSRVPAKTRAKGHSTTEHTKHKQDYIQEQLQDTLQVSRKWAPTN